MNKRFDFLVYLVAFMIIFPGINLPADWGGVKTKRFVLASGEEHGLYYKTGVLIENLAKDIIMESAEVVNLSTTGSIENIERLKDRIADFSILQRDVLLKYYYHSQNPFRKFEIVLPLFPEILQIFVRGKSRIIRFSQFIQQIKRGKIKTFAVGAPGTTSNITIRLILNLYGINLSRISLNQQPYSESFKDFKKGNVSAWAVITGYPYPPMLIDRDLASKTSLVTMNDDQIQYILSRISRLDRTEFLTDVYPFLPKNQKIKGVGTWAFLVARAGVMEEIEAFETEGTLVQRLVKLIKSKKTSNNHPFINAYRNGGFFEFLGAEGSQNFSSKFENYSYFFRGLPLSRETAALFKNSDTFILIYLLVAAILVGLLLLLYKNYEKIDFYKYWIRYRHFIFSTFFLIVGFFICAKVIHLLEANFFKTYSVKSGIVDLSIFDVQIWLFVFVLTRVNNGIFPLSVGGQIVAATATYIGWLAVILSISGEFIFTINKKKRRSGMKKIKTGGHVCICGWNDSAPQLIKNSVNVLKSSFINKKRKIVVISPKFKKYLEKDLALKRLHDRHEVEFINGEPRNMESLESANIIAAKTVLLLADDRTVEADERTLLRALAISRYVRHEKNKSMDSVYTIAEINHLKFKDSLVETDVNEIICSSYITENLIIQSMFSHGVAGVINSVIFFNEGNEFYVVDIKEHPSLAGKTFDELLVILRKVEIQLIGININFYGHSGQPIIDRKEIDKRLNKKGLVKEYIINPVEEVEVCYKTSLSDHLLVFALDEKKIKNIEKRMTALGVL